jgi:ADP-ribose pyrophosphatase
MDLYEKPVNSREIYKGRVFDVRLDTVTLPNGKEVNREFVVHRQAVAVLPVRNDGKLILIRQYRHCAGEELWEIPAGSIDDGEAPEAALQRELAEETGHEAGKFHKLCSVYTTPGFTNEYTHFYMAEELFPKKRKGNDDEFIEVKDFTKTEVLMMISKGLIKDAKTVLAVSYYYLTKKP